jgi:hypothetical protein
LNALVDVLTRAGNIKEQVLFEQTALLIRMIYHPDVQQMAVRTFATALAKAGRFSDALSVLGSLSFDEFLETLAGWTVAFEQVQPGSAPTALAEAIRVMGWRHPDWRNIYVCLTAHV